MNLAPGVLFDEVKHEYFYKGKRLSGITGLISKKLNLKYSKEFVGEHTEEGIHVHKAIQRWIQTGSSGSIHPGVAWLTGAFRAHYPDGRLYSEVLVTDYEHYASSVDIILDTGNGLVLFDIKKGVFKRDYVTWQLSVYKTFAESFLSQAAPRGVACTQIKDCVCICLKDKEFYPIFPKVEKDVTAMLYGRQMATV